MNCITAYVKLSALALVLISGKAFASGTWLPNMVHYINGNVVDKSMWLNSPAKSSTGMFSLSWAEQVNGNYLLEYKKEDDSQWYSLYSGTDHYFVPEVAFDTGVYVFRVNCSGETQCPNNGYVTSVTAVVPAPKYVNSVFKPDSDAISVYWEGPGNAQGHVLEQSTDNGNSWQEVAPVENTVEHQSEDYAGTLHGDENATLDLAAATQTSQASYTKSFAVSAMSKGSRASASYSGVTSTESGSASTSFRYRVKTCVSSACSEYRTSQLLSVKGLGPIFPDPGFESGISDFYVSEGGGNGKVSGISPINQNKSFQVSLKNWGDMQVYYPFDTLRYLNGVSLTGKLRLTSLTPGSRLSVYAVAYYDGTDKRVEGTRYELTSADVSNTTVHELYSTLYLDSSQAVKYVRYIIRLIGGGTAVYTLDDAQMFEGTYLGQDYPVLTSYISSYSGKNKLSWTPFATTPGYQYHVEYQSEGSTSWDTFYRGSELEFSSPETDTISNPDNFAGLLDSGIYHFRIYCGDFGDCPNQYAYATYISAREPAWLNINYNPTAKRMGLAWAETISAYGYLIEENYNGAGWTLISPTSIENSRSYQGNLLFTDNYTKLFNREPGQYQYRVRACRTSGCTGQWRTSELVTVTSEGQSIQFYVPITKYNGFVDTNWAAFKAAGQTYHVEYKPEDGQWSTWYQGTATIFTATTELANGFYHFRLACAGAAGCPSSGYAESFSLVLRSPAFIEASYNASTFDVSLNWANTIDALGYVLEHKVNNGQWREVIPQPGEATRTYYDREPDVLHTLFINYSATIDVNQAGTHYFRVKACRSTRCGSYVETQLDAQVVTLVQWLPATVTVGQPAQLQWDNNLVSQCQSVDTPSITLSQDVSSGLYQTRFYAPQQSKSTLWECFGNNSESLGQFYSPISINKLAAPGNLQGAN